MATSLLSTLIAPMSAEHFLSEHWPSRWLLHDGDPARYAQLPGVAALQDVRTVLRAFPNLVMVVGGRALDVTEGISDRFLTTPDRAEAYYERGATLEFDCADLHIPPLRSAIDEMRVQLGLPAGTFVKAIIYASARGGGFKPHFDAYANFVVHLRGEKEWCVAPNEHYVDPLEHYDMNEPFMSPELSASWKGEVPREMPPETKRVTLRPGTLMFLPRGMWHTTAAASDHSLQLNITFSQPTWLDLVLNEVRARLVVHEGWRRLADGCGADGARRERALKELAQLLEGLPQQLGTLDTGAVFRRHSADHEIFQIANLVFRQLVRL